MAYIARLGARAKVRPDQKLFVAADWASDAARLKGALQLATGLARLAEGGTVKPAPRPCPSARRKAGRCRQAAAAATKRVHGEAAQALTHHCHDNCRKSLQLQWRNGLPQSMFTYDD